MKNEENNENTTSPNGQEVEMTPLKGSEKQVAWAEKIREDFASKSAEYLAQLKESKENHRPDWTVEKWLADHDLEPYKSFEELNTLRELLLSVPEASAWIDGRNLSIANKFHGVCRRILRYERPADLQIAKCAISTGTLIGG